MGAIGKNTVQGSSINLGTSSEIYNNAPITNSGLQGGPVTTPKTAMANKLLILKDSLTKMAQATGSSHSNDLLTTVDDLLNKGTVPRNSQGNVADIIWRVLPNGSTVVISDATNPSDNGLWISGTSTTGSGGVWTHLEDANGNPINESNMGSVINRGADSFGLFNVNGKAKLHIKNFKP